LPASSAVRGRSLAERNDNERRRDRAAQAIVAHDEREPDRGWRPARLGDPDNAEEAIAELICDLRHLADEHGLDWTQLGQRAERYYAEEAKCHVVEVTTEGFQILDTRTHALRADVWSSRGEAEASCDELNRVAIAPVFAA
jgi:hypothetical protein